MAIKIAILNQLKNNVSLMKTLYTLGDQLKNKK